VEALQERIKVVRTKRVPASVRVKRRRQYRKARSKKRRAWRRYKKTTRFKRLKKIRKRLSGRIRKLRRPRRRIYIGAAMESVLRQQEAEDNKEPVEPSDAEEVQKIFDDPELVVVAVADAYATIGQLADMLSQLIRDNLETEEDPDAKEQGEDALAELEGLKDDADLVAAIAGSPDEEGEEPEGDEDDEGEDDDEENDEEPEESAQPDGRRAPDDRPGGEVAGVGWVRDRNHR